MEVKSQLDRQFRYMYRTPRGLRVRFSQSHGNYAHVTVTIEENMQVRMNSKKDQLKDVAQLMQMYTGVIHVLVAFHVESPGMWRYSEHRTSRKCRERTTVKVAQREASSLSVLCTDRRRHWLKQLRSEETGEAESAFCNCSWIDLQIICINSNGGSESGST